MFFTVFKANFRGTLKGELRVPSDKSISHRLVILGSINKGKLIIREFLRSDDCLNTLRAFEQLGSDIRNNGETITINGNGKESLNEPFDVIDLGNSGTSMRLISGVLSGQNFYSVLTGDTYLRQRPMDRIIVPLRKMGATILARKNGSFAPLSIKGKYPLEGIIYKSPTASAQVKSCILLAGLFSNKDVTVIEPSRSRDHTENLLKAFGVDVGVNGLTVSLGKNRQPSRDLTLTVPADISSASFFMVGAAITPGSELTLRDVLLNPTRTGIIDVMRRMNVDFTVVKKTNFVENEPVGDITVRYSPNLKPIKICGSEIPRLIDEIPIIILLASQADGETTIRDASELRVKESDRIHSVVENLNAIGGNAEELPDGMIIHGKVQLKGGNVKSYGDHRIAMTFIVASLISNKPIYIDDVNSISTSYPGFLNDIKATVVP